MALNSLQSFGPRIYRDDANNGGGGGGAGGNQNGGGSGNDGGGAGGGGPGDRKQRRERGMPSMFSPNVEGQYRGFISRYGNPDDAEAVNAASRYMWSELYQVRKKNRELRESLEAFERRVPQNSLVLIGDDVTAFNRLKQRAGGTIAKLEEMLTRLASLEEAETNRAQSQVRADAAKSVGFNAAALADRLHVTGLQLEVREDTQQDGSKKKVAYVRKDDKAAWEPLSVVAARDWKDHLPVLRAAASQSGDDSHDDSSGTGEEYVDFVETGAQGGKATGGSAVDNFIKRRDETNTKRPNPLGAAKTGA